MGARRSTLTLAVNNLAEQGSLIRSQDEWLILEPPATAMSSEPKAPQLMVTAPGSSLWASDDQVEQGPEGLGAFIQHVAEAREASSQDRRRARELAEDARGLRERARRFMPDPRELS